MEIRLVLTFLKYFLGENTLKEARGTKIKILFQRLHMTRVIFVFVLVFNFKICISSTPFNIAF
jgi:hypothetical protein